MVTRLVESGHFLGDHFLRKGIEETLPDKWQVTNHNWQLPILVGSKLRMTLDKL